MSADMARWIDQASFAVHDTRVCINEASHALATAAVRAFLQAAAADGVKLTPREQNDAMEDERDRLWEGDNIEGIWSGVWDVTPNYMDDGDG